jgi:hypothetical protein
MTIEPTSHPQGEQVRSAARSEPVFNDPLLTDVARQGAQTIAGKLPGVGFALRVKESRELERRLRMLELAVERLGGERGDFESRLRNDEDLAELFGRAWDVVSEARSDAQIRVLANAVAAAMNGERLTVSAGHVVLDVLSRLQPLHLQVLVAISWESETPRPAGTDGELEPAGARRASLESRTGIDPDVLSIMMADLEATQLIVNQFHRTWGGLQGMEAWTLTQLGRQVLELLSDVAQPARVPGDA